ncbi:uncharacterized protein TNCV_566221 [Trichonephila clavipes]|nr:uncharacterized protein TNCV_566221 [Trichonephila clavipes]
MALSVSLPQINLAVQGKTKGGLHSGSQRGAIKLSEFNIEWEHRPGVQNVVADVLSRNPASARAIAKALFENYISRYGAPIALISDNGRKFISEVFEHLSNRRPKNPSQGQESIPGESHQLDIRQCNPHTEESRQGARVQYDRARETRITPSKGHSAAEGRPVQSIQVTAVRPCPYYLRSRVKQPEKIPEDQRSNEIDSNPQNNLGRRSINMEALD